MRDFRFYRARPKSCALVATLLALPLASAAGTLAAPMQSATSVQPVVRVKGDGVKSNSWTISQLEKLGPVQTIRTTLKGTPYTTRGVRLWDVVRAANPHFNPKVKHNEAHFVVLSRGKDGYTAAFAWPELMPQIGNKSAFLIWEANGQPLPAKEGAFRLIVPGDQKPMRWVYDLASLEIYNGQRLGATW